MQQCGEDAYVVLIRSHGLLLGKTAIAVGLPLVKSLSLSRFAGGG